MAKPYIPCVQALDSNKITLAHLEDLLVMLLLQGIPLSRGEQLLVNGLLAHWEERVGEEREEGYGALCTTDSVAWLTWQAYYTLGVSQKAAVPSDRVPGWVTAAFPRVLVQKLAEIQGRRDKLTDTLKKEGRRY